MTLINEETDSNVEEQIVFRMGSVVLRTGIYICVPCGFKRTFKKGDTFPRCLSCMERKAIKKGTYVEGLELWEFVAEIFENNEL